jgi:hypothetical protein
MRHTVNSYVDKYPSSSFCSSLPLLASSIYSLSSEFYLCFLYGFIFIKMKYVVQFNVNGCSPKSLEVTINRRSINVPSFRDLEAAVKIILRDRTTEFSKRFRLFPTLDYYNITFQEESSSEFPSTDASSTTYSAIITSKKNNEKAKQVSSLVDDAQHYFILPENSELGDYVLVPTGSDTKFCSCYRSKAYGIEFEASTGRPPLPGPELYLNLRVEKITFRGQVMENHSCNIYYNFKQQYGNKRVTPTILEKFRTSLESNEVWFWYDPNADHHLRNDAEAVEQWLWRCQSETSTGRLVEKPEVRSSPIATSMACGASSRVSPSEFPVNSSTSTLRTSDFSVAAPTIPQVPVQTISTDDSEDKINHCTDALARHLRLDAGLAKKNADK